MRSSSTGSLRTKSGVWRTRKRSSFCWAASENACSEAIEQRLKWEVADLRLDRALVELRDIQQCFHELGNGGRGGFDLVDDALAAGRVARLLELRDEEPQRVHRLPQ